MKNELISFDTAKLAKEKGFDLPVNNFYYANNGELDNGDGDCEFICLNHNQWDRYYSAPTQSELEQWLLQKLIDLT